MIAFGIMATVNLAIGQVTPPVGVNLFVADVYKRQVLDPLFISGLHMGAAGAAIATTIGNILASLYFVWYFLKRSGQLSRCV